MLSTARADDEQPSQLEQQLHLGTLMLRGMVTHHHFDDPFVPTGDALFDAWAGMLQKQMATHPYTKSQGVARLTAAQYDELEKQFGNDPRYWELRYMNALGVVSDTEDDIASLLAGTSSKPAAPLPGRFQHPLDILMEARRRGVVRANTLLLIWMDLVKRHRPTGTTEGLSPEQRAAIPHFILPSPAEAKQERGVLEQAIRLEPKQSWVHYALALFLFSLHEDDKGLAELRIGNGLPANAPQPYPSDELATAARADKPLGNRRVSGAVWLMQISRVADNSRVAEGIERDYLQQHPALSTQAADTWQRFSSKWWHGDFQEAMDQFGATGGMLTLHNTVLDHWQLTELQRDALYRLHGAQRAWMDYRKNYSEPDGAQAIIDATLLYGEDGVYLASWDVYRSEVRENQELEPYLNAMGQLDYTTLTLPTALTNYPPVRTVDLRIKSSARAAARSMGYCIPRDPSINPWKFEKSRDPFANFEHMTNKQIEDAVREQAKQKH